MTTSFPRRKDSLTAVAVLLLFLLMTALFIGLRPGNLCGGNLESGKKHWFWGMWDILLMQKTISF